MQNKDNNYEMLIGQAVSALNLSLSQIKEKFDDHPLYFIEYIEKDVREKSIEVRFAAEQVKLTFSFNDAGSCDLIFLFPDNEQVVDTLIGYLIENCDYSFVKSHFIMNGCQLKIKEIGDRKNTICMVIHR